MDDVCDKGEKNGGKGVDGEQCLSAKPGNKEKNAHDGGAG